MQIIQEGQLKGAFKGFKNRDTLFEFVGGGRWKQSIYKYHYFYSYMPSARVVSRNGGYELEVKDMNDSVEVVQCR